MGFCGFVTGLCRVFADFSGVLTGFKGFPGFYWAILSGVLMGFWRVLMGFPGFIGFSRGFSGISRGSWVFAGI